VRGNFTRPLEIRLNDLLFSVDFLNTQKTGLFLDQANHWSSLLPLARDARVLDLFSYQGGWGMTAARAGAKVTFVDRQENAITAVKRNIEVNKLSDTTIVQADAMKWVAGNPGQFDLIVNDPPAFIKSRKHQKEGEQAYLRLNQYLMKLMENGWLFTFSCSHHLSRDRFLDLLRQAAIKSKREVRVVREFGHGPDHPIHPAMPETRYLKGFALAVSTG